jgi:hypothetical protein
LDPEDTGKGGRLNVHHENRKRGFGGVGLSVQNDRTRLMVRGHGRWLTEAAGRRGVPSRPSTERFGDGEGRNTR